MLTAWPLARFCGNRVPWVTEQVTALELWTQGPNVVSACSKADWKASGLHRSSCIGLFGFVQPLCIAFLLLCADLLRDARKWRCEGAGGGLPGANASAGAGGRARSSVCSAGHKENLRPGEEGAGDSQNCGGVARLCRGK